MLGLTCGMMAPSSYAADKKMLEPKFDKPDKLSGAVQSRALQGRVDNSNMQLRLSRPQSPTLGNFQLNAEHRDMTDPNGAPVFRANVSQAARVLSTYDVELIVDRSNSMRRRDCPGFESRWGWCGKQAEALGAQLEPIAPHGVTVTTFASDYAVYENLAPFQIESLFANSKLQLGTRMSEPLQDRLGKAFLRQKQTGKPTMIVVITDGVPHPAYEPRLVVETLIEASKHMKTPDQIKVVFLQIGSRDMLGQRFLNDLDNNLVSWGAKFDFVQTSTFDHLQKVGLAQALADAVSPHLQISDSHKDVSK